MSKAWDRRGIAFDPVTWAAVLRVLKPGGYLLAFGGTRTFHRIACAIEDAGFEIRDSIAWMYGSGFPKSLNVSKAIDGDRWKGYGTALKPAFEPIIMARKPLAGTVAANVREHGTGAINVDGCRVQTASTEDAAKLAAGVEAIRARGGVMDNSWKNSSDLSGANPAHPAGRWPPNVLLTHAEGCRRIGSETVKANPTWDTPNRNTEPAAFTGGAVSPVRHGNGETETIDRWQCVDGCPVAELGDAARYFPQFAYTAEDFDGVPFLYCPKANRKERDAGLEHRAPLTGGQSTDRQDGSAGLNSPRAGAGRTGGARNPHPTVKPIALLRWLVRLVTPPGGVVLDPFAGSGSCGVAVLREGEGRRYLGVELLNTEAEPFVSIAWDRIAAAEREA
jgi:site-specific DNA-methyltransferase (adenine-specific)